MHTRKHTALPKKHNAKMLFFDQTQEMNGQPSNMHIHSQLCLPFQVFSQDSAPLYCIIFL